MQLRSCGLSILANKMVTVFVWGILTFEAAVYCEKQLVDFSSIILNPQRNVQPPSLGAAPEIDSSEHGVTPGKRKTSCSCGTANRDEARIVGGRHMRPHEYPFLAALSFSPSPLIPRCGATIISNRHALTAAHCTNAVGGDVSLFVIVGEHVIGNSPKSYAVEVERLIQHEYYNNKNYSNDISLLYLETPLRLTEIVSVACMPLPGLSVIGEYVRVLGWGATKFKGLMTFYPQKVDLRVIDTQKCHDYWPFNVGTEPITQICTMTKNRSPCQGDSGGPVVWLDPDTNRYTIVGIVSGGPACDGSSPTIHTSVISYLPWILNGIEATSPGLKLCTKL
uniref:Salivary serine protease n=1 Tax=Triatoma matogrossensis TaxID=162370 RepID=E2J797_9HEMI